MVVELMKPAFIIQKVGLRRVSLRESLWPSALRYIIGLWEKQRHGSIIELMCRIEMAAVDPA